MLVGTVLENEKKNCKAMYETLQLLKNPPKKYLQEKSLLTRVTRLELTAADLKREHAIQSNARRIKRFAEEKKKQVAAADARRQDSLTRVTRETKSAVDSQQPRVNGRYVTLPLKGTTDYEAYSKEPTRGVSRSSSSRNGSRRTSTEVRSVSLRGEWVENEVRNRKTKRSSSSTRGSSR